MCNGKCLDAFPNPEAARRVSPGSAARRPLILLSRVSADAGMRHFIEQRLQPVVRQLPATEFAWSRYAQWLAAPAEWNWSNAARYRPRSLLADSFSQDRGPQPRLNRLISRAVGAFGRARSRTR